MEGKKIEYQSNKDLLAIRVDKQSGLMSGFKSAHSNIEFLEMRDGDVNMIHGSIYNSVCEDGYCKGETPECSYIYLEVYYQ